MQEYTREDSDMQEYTREEVEANSLEYFGDDELAANVAVGKYILKNAENEFVENSPACVPYREAMEFDRLETEKYGGKKGELFDEIYPLMKKFRYIVPQGSVMYGLGNPKPVSLSNCTVVPGPEDTMSSIFNCGRSLANLFKRRAGVGTDISKLRPKGMFVNNSASTTSGAYSFADFFSYVCRMVGQEGRRGALMISIDIRHPDALDFIKMKANRTKVTGANVSVRVTDDFMKAVVEGKKFQQQWPIDADEPEMVQTVDARTLFQELVEMNTEWAEPGILFWDRIQHWTPADRYEFFKTICVNPCAEIGLAAHGSCRLISLCLKYMVDNYFEEGADFDWAKFKKMIHLAVRMGDNLVDLEIEKLEQIQQMCDTDDEAELWGKFAEAGRRGRRIGLGTHGLADCLARLQIRYDSDAAIEKVDEIFEFLRNEAYRASVQLAKERGAFPEFDWEKEKDCAYIKDLPQDIQQDMARWGRRNIALLTSAPTGSVSMMSQCNSGPEPVFRNMSWRRRKLNADEIERGVEVDYVDEVGDAWKTYPVFHKNVEEYLDKMGTDIDGGLPDYFVESNEIDWDRRIDIQAAMQKYIDHSISSTINLPKGTKPHVVGRLYKRAWEKGLKGATIYVDGSRSGVLLSEEDGDETKSYENLLDALEDGGFIDAATNITDEGVITEGVHLGDKFLNGPTEIQRREGGKYYINMSYLPNDESMDHPIALWIHANRMGDKEWVTMNRAVRSLEDLMNHCDIQSDLIAENREACEDDPHHVRLGRTVAMCMRHNIALPRIVKALEGIEDDYVATALTAVRKFLKTAVKDGTPVSDRECPSCGEEALVYEEGCHTCKACGHGGCG